MASTAATASGALTSSTARQPNHEVNAPPTMGPHAPAIAAAPPIVPSARPRSAAGNVLLTMAIVVGSMSAPAAPWITLKTKRIGKVGARPAHTDAAANTAEPSRNTRRRPIRSPSRPPKTSRPASGSRLALRTHCTNWDPTPKL